MATLTATTPTRAGTASPGAPVAASDVIPGALIGSKGCLLEILNGNASTDSMTIQDFSTTAAGSPAAALAPSVTNATNKVFKILPEMGDPANNGQVVVTHSVTPSVTYKLYPLG
jgi:hypothetical protein